MFNINLIIGTVAVAVAVVCVNLFLTVRMIDTRLSLQPQVVTINSADLILKAMSTVESDVTEEEVATLVRAMNAELGSVVRQISAENNVVVVNAASVLSGAPDITDDVLFLLQEVIQ